jgi:hypothetical protein
LAGLWAPSQDKPFWTSAAILTCLAFDKASCPGPETMITPTATRPESRLASGAALMAAPLGAPAPAVPPPPVPPLMSWALRPTIGCSLGWSGAGPFAHALSL